MNNEIYNFDLKDFPHRTTKSRLAQVFGLSRKTVLSYCQIAYEYCDEFAEDYPSYRGNPHNESPLTQYQCWVIYGIYYFVHVEKTPIKIVTDRLFNDVQFQHNFSKEKFKSQFKEIEVVDSTRSLCA